VSDRIRPGTREQLVYVDSDEHSDEGHITESAAVRTAMVRKRAAKTAALLREATIPAAWPGPAGTLVFCFGSTRGTVAEAVMRLRSKGADVAMVHVEWVWPFPGDAVRSLAEGRRVLTVENNYAAQLAALLAQESLLGCAGSVRRYDGRPFSVAEVEAGIERLLGESA
jgi:2-oxoglutarate ferredoxin oxidoreductase subunit alpha